MSLTHTNTNSGIKVAELVMRKPASLLLVSLLLVSLLLVFTTHTNSGIKVAELVMRKPAIENSLKVFCILPYCHRIIENRRFKLAFFPVRVPCVCVCVCVCVCACVCVCVRAMGSCGELWGAMGSYEEL